MERVDLLSDLDGRDLIWLTVLGHVVRKPLPLGVLVSRLGALVLGDLNGSPRTISRCLHEMDRGGHIVLANDGGRWSVAIGPKGPATFNLLMQGDPAPYAPSLNALTHRIRSGFADLLPMAAS